MLKFNIEEYLNSLPEDITVIDVSYKNLKYLPNLSRFKNLKELNCSHNELTILPELNENLQELFCCNNKLTILPVLNENLQVLYCGNNNLTTLPELNENLKILFCYNNNLTILPELNHNLETLFCNNNKKLPEILNINNYCLTDKDRNIINRFIRCKYRIMCLKYREHFRRWLWERVRLPKIQYDYHPCKLLEILDRMKNSEDEEEFMEVIESW